MFCYNINLAGERELGDLPLFHKPYAALEKTADPNIPEGRMYFSFKQVEKLLQISISTLHRWRKAKQFSTHKVGTRWMIPRADVLRMACGKSPVAVKPVDISYQNRPQLPVWMNHIDRGHFVELIRREYMEAVKVQDHKRVAMLFQELTPDEQKHEIYVIKRIKALVEKTLPEGSTP